MQLPSELLRINKRSRPSSSLKGTRVAQIVRETSVSGRMSAISFYIVYGLGEADRLLPNRSKMGELESGSLRVHTV